MGEQKRRAGAAEPGRIALRAEGEMWNAYYAKPDTMEGAVWLGSIRLVAVAESPALKQAFLALIKSMVGYFLRDYTKADVVWDAPVPAPEHERTKQD